MYGGQRFSHADDINEENSLFSRLHLTLNSQQSLFSWKVLHMM